MKKKLLLIIALCFSLQADPRPGYNPMGTLPWEDFEDSLDWNWKTCICSDKVTDGDGTPAGFAVSFIEPIGLMEGTNGSWEFPSFDFILDNSVSKSRGSSQQGGDGSGGFSYGHFIIYPVFSILNFVQEEMCFERVSLMSMGTMCEVDPTCKNDILAAFTKPWALLTSNPIAQALCSADCVASTVLGKPINHLTWCDGCKPAPGVGTNFTKADNQLVDIANNAFKNADNESIRGFFMKTSEADFPDPTPETGVLKSSMCQEQLFFQIIKSQYYLSIAYPTTWNTIPLGDHPISLDFKDKITGSGNGVYWLWRKRDYCAGAYVCRSGFGNAK